MGLGQADWGLLYHRASQALRADTSIRLKACGEEVPRWVLRAGRLKTRRKCLAPGFWGSEVCLLEGPAPGAERRAGHGSSPQGLRWWAPQRG